MSGFFDHLIARSDKGIRTDQSNILQPRLPSLYEVPDGPNKFHVPPVGSSLPDETVQPSFNLRRREDRSRRTVPSTDEGLSKPSGPIEPAAGKIAPAQRSTSSTSQLSVSNRQFQNSAQEAEVSVPGRVVSSIQPASLESIRDVGNEITIRHGASSAFLTDEARMPALDGSDLIHPDARPITTVPEIPSLQPGTLSAVVSRLATREDATREDRWDMAPTVRISIGRIEVRAVPSVPTVIPRAPTAPRPKLTLDEYLRQRNEGKR